MRVGEARAALERAGYVVVEVTMKSDPGPVFIVEGVNGTFPEDELIKLAHRHGAWPPAFERSHSAGQSRTNLTGME